MWKLYTTKKFLARIAWMVQGAMLLSEASWLAIVYLVRPRPGSFLLLLPQYLIMLGGDSRFTFPIGLLALIVDRALPAEPALARQWTPLGRIIAGAITFLVLWLIGAVIIIVLAITFSWH